VFVRDLGGIERERVIGLKRVGVGISHQIFGEFSVAGRSSLMTEVDPDLATKNVDLLSLDISTAT
jgi:hypothetical protein